MIKKLFLDDLRNPPDCAFYMHKKGVDTAIYHQEWVVVRSYEDFVNWILQNGLPEVISFDHDLGDVQTENEKTGYDCAKWLVNYCLDNAKKLPTYYVYSANPVGEENIKGLLEGFRKNNKN